jgi:hypothetical protein
VAFWRSDHRAVWAKVENRFVFGPNLVLGLPGTNRLPYSVTRIVNTGAVHANSRLEPLVAANGDPIPNFPTLDSLEGMSC